MLNLRCLAVIGLGLLAGTSNPAFAQNTSVPSKPNIIIILADDMGFSDIGCFGSEIKTPNLDGLAANGLRFTRFYNTSRCCPSRAALLTGLYSHQAGVGNMTADQGMPGYQGRLNDRCVTIAEVLQQSGYLTAICGKWHVGGNQFIVTPWKRGFQHGLAAPAGGFYYGNNKPEKGPLWLDGTQLNHDDPALGKDWYTTDLFTDYAIKYIDQAKAEKKPLFLYLAHTAPHFPLLAPAGDVAKYRGKYLVGWDKLRADRYAWQTRNGIIDPKWPLSPLPKEQPNISTIASWDLIAEPDRDRYDQIMSLYAACVDHLDQSIGRLVAKLKKEGMFENTLLIFLSDNGGNGEGGPYGKLNEGKHGPSAYCGQAWATLENTPFRYYKHFEHEGGTSSPFIAHWPARIKKGGAITHEPAHIIDLMPTCVEVAGAKYPTQFNGNTIQPMEGRSIVPAFTGGKVGHTDLFWEHNGNAAVLSGDWKLARVKDGPWELYYLPKDRTELHNLAAQEPARVKELDAKWNAWANRASVLPKPDKADKKAAKQAKKAGGSNDEKSSGSGDE